MNITLRPPSVDRLDRVLAHARERDPSLLPSAMFAQGPEGFRLGSTMERVGSGGGDARRARELVASWAFLPSWAQCHPTGVPPEPGQTVLMIMRTFGLWSILPSRIVEVIDDERQRRFGFVYSAVPPHVANGYERFVVSHDPDTDDVVFEVSAVAQPSLLALRLARPLFSFTQRRFRRACMRTMRARIHRNAPAAGPEV